jgi:hypothetical protein
MTPTERESVAPLPLQEQSPSAGGGFVIRRTSAKAYRPLRARAERSAVGVGDMKMAHRSAGACVVLLVTLVLSSGAAIAQTPTSTSAPTSSTSATTSTTAVDPGAPEATPRTRT